MLASNINRLDSFRQLRGQVDRLTRPKEQPFSTGMAAIDRYLPWGGLPQGSLHEISGRPGDGAALGFAVQCLRGAVGAQGLALWLACDHDRDTGAFYGPGLAQFDAPLERMYFARLRKPADLLWSMEEALRSRAFTAVFAETEAPDLTATRRLQIAAEDGGCAAFLLAPPRAGRVSAAVTRWQVAAAPVERADRLSWRVTLARCRGAEGRIWQIDWTDETLRLPLAPALADGPACAAE